MHRRPLLAVVALVLAGATPLAFAPGLSGQAGAPDRAPRRAAPPTSSRASWPRRSTRRSAGTMVVENKAGGGGSVGANEIASRRPTATIGMATVSTTAPTRHQPEDPVQPADRLHAIINVAATPNVIAVHPSFRPRTARIYRRAEEEPRQVQLRELGHGRHRPLQTELFKNLGHLHHAHPTAAPARR